MLLIGSFKPSLLPLHSQTYTNFSKTHFQQILSLHYNPKPHPHTLFIKSELDIDMIRTKDGSFVPKSKKVVVLWDLDNKPPKGPPYDAAVALKSVALKFGDVIDFSAYANRHAFIHLPQWVIEERRERRELDRLERKVASPEPYICSVCGRKCKTNIDLKKHFRQLHERERQKKLSRMRSLKGKKRRNFKERFIAGNDKYNEAARSLLMPKVGYGLEQELRRAGVYVKTVQDKPQAADWALKRQIMHSMSRGVDWIVLVSDDSDFCEMLRKARDKKLGTVVVGDRDGALGRHADVWVPWISVQNGVIKESDLELKSNERFSVSEFDGEFVGTDLDEIIGVRGGFRGSEFSEGEDEYEEAGGGNSRMRLGRGDNTGRISSGLGMLFDSDEDEDEYDDDDDDDDDDDMFDDYDDDDEF